MSQTYMPTFTAIEMGLRPPQTPGVGYILFETCEIKEAPGDQKMGRGRRQRVARMRKLRERLKGK